jgi:hypothetical protein
MLRRLFRSRKYRSGSRWAFWRWSTTPSGYLTRLHLWQTPWFLVCLHWIDKPDQEPHLHDHPTNFLSLILRGWYWELRTTGYDYTLYRPATTANTPVYKRRWWNRMWASPLDRHKIVEVSPGGALTLCFMSKGKRTWGFHTPEGWVSWKDYNAAKYTRAGR